MKNLPKIEIAHISSILKKIARCDAFQEETKAACLQAVQLLQQFRKSVLDPNASHSEIITKLRTLLAEQGEG